MQAGQLSWGCAGPCPKEKRSRPALAFSKASSVAGLCGKGLGLFSAPSDRGDFRHRAGGECGNKVFTEVFPPALPLMLVSLAPLLPCCLVFHGVDELPFSAAGAVKASPHSSAYESYQRRRARPRSLQLSLRPLILPLSGLQHCQGEQTLACAFGPLPQLLRRARCRSETSADISCNNPLRKPHSVTCEITSTTLAVACQHLSARL